MRKTNDATLLRESMRVLERTPCQFWACQGPTLQPIAMVTCFRCAMLAKLQQRFGCYETPPLTKKARS